MKRVPRNVLTYILLFSLLVPALFLPASSLGEDIESTVSDTGLPVICIDVNDGSGITDRETYKAATMYIKLNDEYKAFTNDYTEKGGAGLVIKGRGNSTWTQFQTQKRPYTIKLDKKTALFGMRKSKKWTLIANFMDRSNLRNKLAYDLSGQLGLAYCQSVFVNLYLNGTYLGVYQLCERPDVDEEIYDWEDIGEDIASAIRKAGDITKAEQSELETLMKNDLSWITSGKVTFKGKSYTVSDYIDISSYSLQGGYLIEYDYYFDEPSKFKTGTGVPLNIRSPEQLRTNDTLMGYLQTLFADFEEALYSDNFYNGKGRHYSEYIDIDSFVDYYIVNAFFLNVEFGYKSMYLYIDGTGIITMGPVWDFDWSSGNHFLGSSSDYANWYNDWRGSCNTWYRRMYRDPWFVALIADRFYEVKNKLNGCIDDIEYYYGLLEKASTYEIGIYNSLPGESDFRKQLNGYTFRKECDKLKSFLQNRLSWMSSKLNAYDPAIEESGPKLDDRMIMKLFSGGTELSKGSGAYAANYALRTTPENELDLTFSMDSTQGVTNTFEIYVNGVYITKFTAQKASVKIPCSALTEGLNVITAVRIREGVYYGTCNYITLDADLYLKRVEPAEYKLTPKTLEYGEKVELVALGSEWRYYVTTRDRYDRMNGRGWMNVGYNDSTWDSHSAPLGDRLTSAASEIGWTGNNHTLFVRQTFDFDKSQLKENSSFFFNIYYDNTIYVYLNGNLIYSDDTAVTGKNDWTDSYVTIKLDDISEYLVNGKNLIAVSINDSAGGRELDLSLYAMSYTDSGYKNPTANEKPENTKLGENGGALYITARNNEDNPDKTDMLTLISLPESDYDGEGVLEISFKGQSWNTTYTEKLSRLGDYGRVISDGDVFVPADGTLLLGYVIKGIPDKWQTLTVKVTSGGGTLLLSECGRTEINEKCGIK